MPSGVDVPVPVAIFNTCEPEFVMVNDDGVEVIPVGDTTVTATIPVNPPRDVILMAVVLLFPCITLTGLGEALIVKSMTLTVTIALWDREPLEPVTVTV